MLTFDIDVWYNDTTTVYQLLNRVYDSKVKYLGSSKDFNYAGYQLQDSFTLSCDAGDSIDDDILDTCNAKMISAIDKTGNQKTILKHTLCKKLLKKRLAKQ